MLDRVPPQNIDAERAVLGALMLPEGDGNVLGRVLAILPEPEMFYMDKHKKIYSAILRLSDKDEPADLLTVTEELAASKELEHVGGVPYLDEMQDSVPSASNAEYYAKMIKEMWVRRRMIYTSSIAYNDAFLDDIDIESTMATLEDSLISIRRGQGIAELVPISRALKPALVEIQRVYDTKDFVTGLNTGFPDLDEITGGFHKGHYMMLGARTSVGKSTFVRNLVDHIAVDNGVPCLVFSLESAELDFTLRMMACRAGIAFHSFRRGQFPSAAWYRLVTACSELAKAPIYVDDTPDITPSQIRAKSQMFVSEHGNECLIVVDHIHEVRHDRRIQIRNDELREISDSLKATCRRLNVPMLVLAQLSRATERRDNKRPKLSDLRACGTLEQAPDLVLFIYRDDYYEDHPTDYKAEIIVAKQRNGLKGTIKIKYDATADRYRPLSWEGSTTPNFL